MRVAWKPSRNRLKSGWDHRLVGSHLLGIRIRNRELPPAGIGSLPEDNQRLLSPSILFEKCFKMFRKMNPITVNGKPVTSTFDPR
jgi:hypothetical protein